ncbi:stage II sporulation protein M [Paenibacillus humicola]|uniref:stage II sporulation protein M n=1 Tax=Paenibacillus humicola TaxID=3110540 RepID=UPI00237BDCAB|nr:stage II sporulation protein M [Paenibacillus humicola]
MFALREIFRHLKTMRHYLALSSVILLAGMVVGGTNPAFEAFIEHQLTGLKQMANLIDDSSNPTLYMMGFIFFNNAYKALLVMAFGALFGIIPIVFLAINGMILGYVIHSAAEKGGGMLADVIFKGLLPHGIIEIPALVIACAYGVCLGKIMLRGAGAVIVPRKEWGSELRRFLRRAMPAAALIVGMLLVAAVIESTVTVWLLRM